LGSNSNGRYTTGVLSKDDSFPQACLKQHSQRDFEITLSEEHGRRIDPAVPDPFRLSRGFGDEATFWQMGGFAGLS
jgi:hypothetical protein